MPIDTLEAPEYAAFDPSIKVPTIRKLSKSCSPKAASRTASRPSSRSRRPSGFKPKDFEIIQAIVGMWRKVGAEATIEVYEIAKHFELRRHKLAPAAFYNWGNSIGDPSTSTGFAMFGPSPHSRVEDRGCRSI